ncbi:hypothetical protein FA15DRAFT_608437 [Coprinopsis marcescibilis]|uniref:ARM repeat-containing protein n=1 Tax=Coprinopsis marcescibilis TaxID=230819 RepID=A0A5C3LFH0_COPMA|nr:hypothetical protein FA15DRAFT_608437 [Coprinopsis marcescibilis]
MAATLASNSDFQRLKAICVPILGSAKLTPSTIPKVSSLLSSLLQVLRDTDSTQLNDAFIGYIFFPLKAIFERNTSAEIPDQILEKLFLSLALLCDSWWWTCGLDTWRQIFIICGSVVGGIESKGKAKARDDETKEAAISCLISLLRQRSPKEALARRKSETSAQDRYLQLKEMVSAPNFIPIIGQTLDSILGVTLSPRTSLQEASLQLLHIIVSSYAPEDLVPTVLPGVASSMTKVCLGSSVRKGWVNGDIVAAALNVLGTSIVKAIGDNVCVRKGALSRFEDLEGLASFGKSEENAPSAAMSASQSMLVSRTPSWLRGTASQLHIALNSLHPLVKHPTPSAIYALIELSSELLPSTRLTLPDSQPILLSFLLSATNSEYPKVSAKALASLSSLLSNPVVGHDLLERLTRITADNLSALPRLLSTQSDARVQHVAELITAVCRIGVTDEANVTTSSISKAIGKLLGPSGGIEKWGWSLLAVLELVNPPVTLTHTSSAQLMLENNPETSWIPFPELVFKNVSLHETRRALEEMLRALGEAGGDACLFSAEWFIDVGRGNTLSRSVAAMWCACRLLEGIAGIQLSSESSLMGTTTRRSKRLEKQMRAIARNISEVWDRSDFDDLNDAPEIRLPDEHEELEFGVQHQKGLMPLDQTLKIIQAHPGQSQEPRKVNQPVLHRSLCLQLIAIAAGVLQSRFNNLFIFTIYPMLHSIVSPESFLSSSGLAALNYVTVATSYASPANLLLSNFDYALDSVSRRLTRRWLDIDATKVLVVLIKLVGRDVVDKAGDVVEECFDRLDAYHGYNVIVDGLIEVLLEVLNVIDMDVKANPASAPKRQDESSALESRQLKNLDDLFDWLPKRKATQVETDDTDYGPAPREAWGKKSDEEDAESKDISKDQQTDEPQTSSQLLTKQIIARSLYFLTHESPTIRARVLTLLALSVPSLPESVLLPSINNAWPFILNRLSDHETFVVSAAANLVEVLAVNVGSFMYRRIWDDIWPRFKTILKQLERGDSTSALAKRTHSAVGTESAYTHSHRLYRSLLVTMTAVMRGVHLFDPSFWECLILFRPFLGQHTHQDLQDRAKELYSAAAETNSDAVWLVLEGTVRQLSASMAFMNNNKWHIETNVSSMIGGV